MTEHPGRFSKAEFHRRWDAVRLRIQDSDMDALAVTSRSGILYLTGHDPYGAYEAPYVLLVTPDGPAIFVVRAYDERSVRDDIDVPLELRCYFGRLDAMRVVAEGLRSLDLGSLRLGAELDCWGLAPKDVDRLGAEFPELNVSDASSLVRSVSEVKSAEEIDVMRTVMRLNDLAVRVFYDHVREGASERQTCRAMEDAVLSEGGEFNPTLTTVLFGDHTGTPHGAPTTNVLRRGDVALTELGAFYRGYSTGLCRTAVLGRHAGAEALHEVAEEATQVAIDSIRPGATTASVHEAVKRVIEAAGRGSTFLQRTGYCTGVTRFDRGFTSMEPQSEATMVPGMTFHMPRILFDESGAFGVGTSESVLVTESGAEVLSAVPRELILVD